jgi:hypothetical protein
MPFGRLGRLSVRFLCSTAFVAVVFLTSCGSSDPVIVSGTIETYGESGVDVAVYRGSDQYESDPIDMHETHGNFEIRGTLPASDARDLFLAVFTSTFSQSCGAVVNLPPLRLSEGRWVNAATGEPVVLNIKPHKIDPEVALGDQCPAGGWGSGTDTSDG